MSVSLGKRKVRDVDETVAAVHGSTLFVSNLPYTATSVDLQTLFSDLAPVRSAFIVTEHGTGVSKGVGYVSFAIREDAQSAFETITKDGLVLQGRSLRVQWAESKKGAKGETATEADSKPAKKPKAPKEPTSVPHDPLAIRTIIISGLPSSVDTKTLWKKVRKCEGAESVEWPAKSADGTEDPTTARALFHSPWLAQDAVNKLHAHVFKGSLLSVTLKKRLDGLAKPVKPSKQSVLAAGGGEVGSSVATPQSGLAPSRASRLIVRNLPWDATEADLRALFLPYGPIHQIDVLKGFAFVWMLSKKDAERAVEGVNGASVRAGMANDIVKDKQRRKKEIRLEAKRRAAQASEPPENNEGDNSDDEKDEEPAAESTGKARVIAVDWALSKGKWEEEKKKIEEAGSASADEGAEPDASQSSSSSESGSESDSSNEESDSDASSNQEDPDEDDDEASNAGKISERDDNEEAVRPQLPAPEVGTTLFVRNVPYEATEEELRTLFRAFGPLRYARITMDPETGRGRGTGFACFWNKEDADKALTQSELLKSETQHHTVAPAKKNPFKLPSLLTPDPSSSMAQSLVLHGRTLDLARAVTRDEAGKLKEAGERAREKADKRNLYLLREGLILPNTPAAANLPPPELEKRSQSFNARRTLLKSNPSLYVSKTRLSVRQLPPFVTERTLKRLAIHAVRAFEEEVTAGTRQALTEDELHVDAAQEGEDGGAQEVKKAKKKFNKKAGRHTAVKQAKVILQGDRIDPVTGKGKSKGYGFLELHTHADALRVLRWANNNPTLGPLLEEWWKAELKDLIEAEEKNPQKDAARVKRMKDEMESGGKKTKGTLIIEFSIENIQVVQRRANKQKEAKENPKTSGSLPKLPTSTKTSRPEEDEDEEDEEARPPTKKARKSSSGDSPSKLKDKSKDKESKGKPASDSHLGSIIGRKRKQRKMMASGK